MFTIMCIIKQESFHMHTSVSSQLTFSHPYDRQFYFLFKKWELHFNAWYSGCKYSRMNLNTECEKNKTVKGDTAICSLNPPSSPHCPLSSYSVLADPIKSNPKRHRSSTSVSPHQQTGKSRWQSCEWAQPANYAQLACIAAWDRRKQGKTYGSFVQNSLSFSLAPV